MGASWMREARRRQRREWGHPEVTRPDLREPWGEWLGARGWDWYATMTFAEWTHPDAAAQRYHDWARALYAEVGQPMDHARALEWQKRGVVHFHALIAPVSPRTSRRAWRGTWEEIAGGFCRIEPYDAHLGARYYLGKYVTKGGAVDMLFYGPELRAPDDARLDPRRGGALG